MLVGRGRELALLADCLAQGRPAVLVGEAGVGKTTALRAAAMTTGRKVFEGGGLSTLSWMECLPLRRAVGDSLTAADAAAVATQVQRVVKDGVLLLDDLHWSDAMTVEATALLGGHCGLLTAVRR
ncbi:MAG TPA: ATP-binding protein, partial [Streptosporangiaceae bacterium]|nr:ATP-binding protein [Streptosporangiaceae bacterium]